MAGHLLQDLRFGARQLRTSPGFTAVAVLSLALGIGANSAIFQLVNAVRLRTLPVRNPQELATPVFAEGSMRSGWYSTRSSRLTWAQWEQLQSYAEPFSGLMAWSAMRFNLMQGGEARYAEGLYVSADFFRVLGVEPLAGRTFTAEDDRPGCGAPGAVIGYGFWQREFAGDRGVLGRRVRLDGREFPIVGVMPAEFFGVEVGQRFDVAVPLCADSMNRARERSAWWIASMGRLKPGWTQQRATAYLQALSPAIMEATLPTGYRPDQAKLYLKNKLEVLGAAAGVSTLRRPYENPLWLLLAATGLVLAIACANLANLLLARASVREREIALRQAIGASRSRLVRQLLSESLLLAVLGMGLGVVLAQVLVQGLVVFLTTAKNPFVLDVGMDLRTLGFSAAVAVATCLLFGLAPALRATRVAPAAAMRSGGRGATAGRERHGLRRGLMTAQVALSMVLLVGAVLFERSLQNLLAVQPGFRAEGVVAVHVDLGDQFPKDRRLAAFREIVERVNAQPGVVSAGHVFLTPLSGAEWDEDTRADSSTATLKNANFNQVGPGYFRTMGIGLVAGRDFNDHDAAGSPQVAVITEAFAKVFYGNANPLGHTFRMEPAPGRTSPTYEVVGVVRNSKFYELREEPVPAAYFGSAQDASPGSEGTVMVRVAGRPEEIYGAVKAAVAAVNPAIGLEFHVFSAQIAETLVRDRLMAALGGAFGLLAAVLAAIGLYGVIAYMVARRQSEIGVRMALGADRASVVRLVLGETVGLLVVGIGVGTALALWAGQAAAKMLFGLKPNDASTFVVAGVMLAATALAASYLPAWRAAKIDPMEALRAD